MSEIKVRHSDSNDILAIRDIYSGKVAYLGTLQLPFPSIAVWESHLENLPQGIYSLVAETEGDLIGQIGLQV